MAGIYLHIPFCKQACHYCNFHFSTALSQMENMIAAMLEEIKLNTNYLSGAAIETIYFGGGTPSLLNSDELNRFFDAMAKAFPLQERLEVTLEANPDDIDIKFLHGLKSTPVNRFSLGIQSFREADLKFMHRAHNAQQAEYAIKAVQDAGYDNISIDLIYGTPGLSNDNWKEHIHYAQEMQIPHISSYALTVEPKTALAHAIQTGKVKSPDAAQTAEQFLILMEEMEAGGYVHYEISNFAKDGKYAVHNTNYWRGKHYLGIGPSAHSFNGYSRQWNVANNALYIKSLLDHKLHFEHEILSTTNRINEYIMTSLRTIWGLDLEYVSTTFGSEARRLLLLHAQEAISRKQVEIQDECLVLTKNGKLFADAIASDLFFEDANAV